MHVGGGGGGRHLPPPPWKKLFSLYEGGGAFSCFFLLMEDLFLYVGGWSFHTKISADAPACMVTITSYSKDT